jgi:hypothetical protein
MIMVVDPGVQAMYGKKLEDSNERKKQTKKMPDHPRPGPT